MYYFTLTLHKSFQTPLIQYLYAFKEYVEVAKEKQFDMQIKQGATELIIITNGKNEVKPHELELYFKEYVEFAFLQAEDRIINYEGKGEMSPNVADFLHLKIDNVVGNLKNQLRIAKMELQFLRKDHQSLLQLHEQTKIGYQDVLKEKNEDIAFLRSLSKFIT